MVVDVAEAARQHGAADRSAEMSKLQQRLVAAGYRRNEALIVFFGVRVGLALLAFVVLSAPLFVKPNLASSLIGAGLGYVLPGMVLGRLARKPAAPDPPRAARCARPARRQRRGRPRPRPGDSARRRGADVRASRSVRRAAADQPRAARRQGARPRRCSNLGERTGVDDVISLVAMLVQTDKFGTSVAQSLRVHSDTLRTKRRQRAEERPRRPA